MIDIRSIATRTHGRILVQPGTGDGLILGFHGYYESAEVQMARLRDIPGSDAWTLVSVQGLHRFYRGRSHDVVASWMTRQDRELAIADNIAYVDAVVAGVKSESWAGAVVCVGFSQGAAMAFRAAARARVPAAGIVAVGADVPPDVRDDAHVRLPPVLLIRGSRDEFYTQAMFEADAAALTARGGDVNAVTIDAPHDWTADVARDAGYFIRRFRS
ncbi:MAG TPA: dienelactone hydrolase family protein [Vicinamibacterales bacterium]|nr:dienelactone hydrolase family protein [Vicinamibacterales bacterium]